MPDVKEPKKITIYTIAKEAGVSPATVSRVLTNNAKVNPDKRERIEAVIRKYDFKPNVVARSLSDMKRNTIGFIVSDIRNPFYSDIFAACEIAAGKAGYSLMLLNSYNNKAEEASLLDKFDQQMVDGIIQIGGNMDELISDEDYASKINQITDRIPVVTTGKMDGTNVYSVFVDDFKALDLIFEHLISLGHSKIALVGGFKSVLSTFNKVMRFKQLIQKYKLPVVEEFCNHNNTSYDYESGYAEMQKIFDSGELPTAVIAINDFTAAGIHACIRDNHYKIPEDISLVSFDNTYIAECMRPTVTSIDYNYPVFGEELIDSMIKLIDGKTVEMRRVVDPILKIRNSSGPVKRD